MRIIAGNLKGRAFDSPHGHRTHPMSEKMRGALFNILGDIEGLTVFDAFAGSGALSFEAISRGASSALAIEQDKHAHHTIEGNIKKLGLENQVKAVRANASSWSTNNYFQKYNLVLLDPPYDELQLSLIQKLSIHTGGKGLVALSWPGYLAPFQLLGFKIVENKTYGDSQLVFYRKI